MPTEYTDSIKDNISFKEFALNCARAFGACVTLRDSPVSPIPDEFKPTDYHVKELKRATEELVRIKKLTNAQCQYEAELEFKLKRQGHNKYLQEKLELKVKYEDMLLKVKKWEVPSSDHIEFKKFMVDQIESSIKFDCSLDYEDKVAPKPLSGKEWYDNKISNLHRDIEYHTKENEAEIERVNKRNDWIRQLRESL